MKKFLLFLLVFLACMPCASALRGAGYPAYDGTSIPENAVCGTFDGQSLSLEFDPSGEFSYLKDGYLQACFFAFDQTKNTYLELYLMLPATITAGTVLNPQSEIENNLTSVSVFEITGTDITDYFASQDGRVPYPANANYTIYIDDVQAADGGALVCGRLEGTLARFVNAQPTAETIVLSGVQFHFTLPFLNGKDAPAAAPAFTLPPDYAVI